ncbi:MAG TPA: hypothetical protein VLA34_15330, partial [Candidatus Krumholzibacterium sp.]|nr:hypothetical protein [Candidatus Krumholzibacterium sp.]
MRDSRSDRAAFPAIPPRVPVFSAALIAALLLGGPSAAAPIHTTYLWHMHQPVYWPDRSGWTPTRYETAYET